MCSGSTTYAEIGVCRYAYDNASGLRHAAGILLRGKRTGDHLIISFGICDLIIIDEQFGPCRYIGDRFEIFSVV